MRITEQRPPGRPRDPAIDAAVLEATRALLIDVGYAGTTVQAVARAAGVHPPAVYRRWPTKRSLIEDALFSEIVDLPVAPTGDLHSDLLRFLEAYEAMIERPAARAAIPALLAAYQAGAEAPDSRWAHLSVRPQLEAILQAATAPTDPDLDADELFEIVLAVMVSRTLLPPTVTRRRPLQRVVELLARIVTQ